MAYIIFNVDSISVGSSRNLKDIPVGELSDGYRAHLKNGNEFSVFVFNSTSTDTEDLVNFPRKIRPSDYISSGVWEEIVPSKNYIDEIETELASDISDLQTNKEDVFSKNTAFNKNFGSTSNTVCEGDDSRLSNPRTPTAHTHPQGEVTGLTDALAWKEPVFTKNSAFNKNFGTGNDNVPRGDDSRFSDARTPTAHTHVKADITDTGLQKISDISGIYGSINISGEHGGYAGINFDDVQLTLLVHPNYQGFYTTDTHEWQWHFNNGVLAAGSVPWTRLTDVPNLSNIDIASIASLEYRGTFIKDITNFSSVTLGQLVTLSGGNWIGADYINVNYPAMGLCVAVSGSNATILLNGFFRYSSATFTPGPMYLGTGGNATQTKPTASGLILQEVGVAVTSDIIHFNPSGYTTIELS